MRKFLLMTAALATGALAQIGTTAQAAQQTAANEDMKATGMVTKVDQDKHQIKVGDQTFMMPMGGGAAVMPQVGSKVTLYYEEKNGQKTVTRIGQAQ